MLKIHFRQLPRKGNISVLKIKLDARKRVRKRNCQQTWLNWTKEDGKKSSHRATSSLKNVIGHQSDICRNGLIWESYELQKTIK